MKKILSKTITVLLTLTLAFANTGCEVNTSFENNLSQSSVEYNTDYIEENLGVDNASAVLIAKRLDEEGAKKLKTNKILIVGGNGTATFGDGKNKYIINVDNGFISTINDKDGNLICTFEELKKSNDESTEDQTVNTDNNTNMDISGDNNVSTTSTEDNTSKDTQQAGAETLDGSGEHSIIIGGVPVTLNLDPSWDPYYSDIVITCNPDDDISISYSDSYIDTGDEQGVSDEIPIIKNVFDTDTVDAVQFDLHGQTGYMLQWISSDGWQNIRIFEPIPGASSYLKIEIVDYTGEKDPQELANMYSLDV